MRKFEDIYQTACIQRGGAEALELGLPSVNTAAEMSALPDQYFLSNMSLRIFRAGLKHEMVDKKWPAFEEVFKQFDPFYCAMLSDDDIDTLVKDERIIRHLGKIKSVRHNGGFVRQMSEEYGGFGKFLAQWPEEDIVGLWLLLKKQAKQMGGISGPYFLRMVGKDTFLFTRDVVAVLKLEGVIEKEPTSQKDIKACQAAFLQWQQESGRTLAEISRIVSIAAM